MGFVRMVRRLVLFGAITVLGFVLVLLTAPLVTAVRGSSSRWRAAIVRRWARLASPILGMRVTVVGPRPRPPFFLVANHLSYLDVLVLASQAPCVFVAKAEIARWPLVGTLCRAANTLFIERESGRAIPGTIERIGRELRGGVGVVVFPEATSSPGAEVLRFRPALLEAPARSGMAVSFAAITYSTPPGAPPAQEAVCWWGDMTFTGHFLRLLRIGTFDARVTFGDEPIADPDRKALAERLHDAVSSRFAPGR